MMPRFSLRALLLVVAGAVLGGGAWAAEPPGLKVAAFECDVTPPLGTVVYKIATETIEHPLYAKGVVLDDRGTRYVLCSLDWRGVARNDYARFRARLAEAAGTAPSRVALHSVHQHTAPSAAEMGELLPEMIGRVADAVREAVGRLEPCDRIGVGQAKVDRVASTRRIPIEGGKVLTRYTSTKGRPELRELPEGFIDPYLKTITLARGDKPLVRLHYYATHPQSFYLDGRICYDFPGMARERMQEQEGVVQIYFTGCGGDIGAGKYNDGSREARGELADRLFAGMEAAAAATEFHPVEPIRWRTVDLVLPSRSGGAEQPIGPMELNSLEMGKVRIVHLPGEPMVAYQIFAQESLPEAFVAVAGYGDGWAGYICTEAAFSEGGYEVRVSRVAPESETVVKAAIRQLLGLE